MILHEEDADQRRRGRRPDDALRLSQLDLDPVGKRPIDPLFHRPQCGQRRGVLPLGRAANRPFGDAEGEIQLIVAESQRLLFLAPQLCPLARFAARSRSGDDLRRLTALAGTASKTSPHLAASVASIGSPEVIIWIAC